MKIITSNVLFSGETAVYNQYKNVTDLDNTSIDDPKGADTIFYEAGQINGYVYFSMKY